MSETSAEFDDRTCRIWVPASPTVASAAALVRGVTRIAAAIIAIVMFRAVFAIAVPSSPPEAGSGRENWHRGN
jgi:hypothetical protein